MWMLVSILLHPRLPMIASTWVKSYLSEVLMSILLHRCKARRCSSSCYPANGVLNRYWGLAMSIWKRSWANLKNWVIVWKNERHKWKGLCTSDLRPIIYVHLPVYDIRVHVSMYTLYSWNAHLRQKYLYQERNLKLCKFWSWPVMRPACCVMYPRYPRGYIYIHIYTLSHSHLHSHSTQVTGHRTQNPTQRTTHTDT